MDTYIGFDSAWTDNPKAPGAIAAICIEDGRPPVLHPPRLVSFASALDFIRTIQSTTGVTLIALDQPTLVPNATSMRPVERAAASLISWIGGGVQPSNTGRIGMFCPASPVWKFLADLNATENPEEARTAKSGLYLMEVFPALALASMHPDFFGRLSGPRYNPARHKTFRPTHWIKVAEAGATQAETHGCADLATWFRQAATNLQPKKADQDKLDAALCVLIALHWRLRPRTESILLGDLTSGYMVLPATPPVRERLTAAAARTGVSIY